MAPYLSLLPVRKNAHRSALPRPKTHSSSTSVNNNPSLPPPPPLRESPQPRVEPDVSTLDFEGLLAGQQEEDEEFELLNDEQVPDFLVDQSLCTVGAPSPRKKGKERAIWETVEEEQEVEDEIPRYDDSDVNLSRSLLPAATTTSSQSFASPTFSPRPPSTPSFRQSPARNTQQLFDELEPSMNGDYTSNSNRSESFVRPTPQEEEEEREEDSTFTVEREGESIPPPLTPSVREQGQEDGQDPFEDEETQLEQQQEGDLDLETTEQQPSEFPEPEFEPTSRTEAEVSISEVEEELESVALEVQETVQSSVEVIEGTENSAQELDDQTGTREGISELQNGTVSTEAELSIARSLAEEEEEEHIYPAQHLSTNEQSRSETQQELVEEVEEVTFSTNEDEPSEGTFEAETQVPVKFGDEEASMQEASPLPEEKEGPSRVSLVEDIVPAVMESPAPTEEPPVPTISRKRVSEARLPLPVIEPATTEALPSKATTSRPFPFVASAPSSKRARHSIAASRPAHILPSDHPAHRRRQSLAPTKASSEWRVQERKAERKGKVVDEVNPEEAAVEPSPSTNRSPPVNLSLPLPEPIPSVAAESPPPRASPTPPPPNDDVSLSQPRSQSFENSFVSRRSSSDNSLLPLSPSPFEADTTLPVMGAPLDFQRAIEEIGHSTPAKPRPRRERLGRAVDSDIEEGEGTERRGGFEIETIEEVTEEETSVELVREKSAERVVGTVGPEEEEGEAETVGQVLSPIQEEVEAEEEQEYGVRVAMSPSVPSFARDTGEPSVAVNKPALDRGVPTVQLANDKILPLDPASSAPLPLPIESTVIKSTFQTSTVVRNSDLSRAHPLPPAKRTVRVSLAAPPPPPRTKAARRASTSVINTSTTVRPEQSKKERERKPVRVSLAAPPVPSTTTHKPRPSRVAPEQSMSTKDATKEPSPHVSPQPTDEVIQKSPSPTLPAAVQFVDQPTTIEETVEQITEIATPSTQPETADPPTTSPNLPPAPLPVSASSAKLSSSLTLPTTFSFGGKPSDGLTRDQERQKRKEERERREKRVEEALKAKKESMQRGSGWKKTEASKVTNKRKAVENGGNAKRLRTTTTSENGSSSSRTVPLKASTSTSVARPATQPALPAQPQPAPVTSSSNSSRHVVTETESRRSESQSSTPALKLTKDTLEANRVATGPRIDLNRRISSFLESLEEDGVNSRSDLSERQLSVEEGAAEQVERGDVDQEFAPEVLEAVQPLPIPGPAPSPNDQARQARPPSRAQSDRSTSTASRPIASAPKRLTASTTTTAKPFTFAAPRPPRAQRPAPPPSNASTASPMFTERLSAWKAREKEAIGKGGKRKAVAPPPPPPMPFRTKNNRPAPSNSKPTSSTTMSNSALVAKRPRIESSAPKQGRGGKENEPSLRSINLIEKEKLPPPQAQKKQEKAVLKVVGGGVAEEMEKRLKEKLEWSERQKKREEEVRKRKEAARLEEAEQERKKLQALRAALTVDKRSAPVRPAPGRSAVGRK
ncbi:uncharacterized protein JCM6883_005254 [Sporobolomyces salmoneus]|uniref:uncharacterized protein n=1 Tax=Sporobolomyces salmoneus TaxID=183962 RepID=UPI0031702A2E